MIIQLNKKDPKEILKSLAKVPTTPGVYIYKNSHGKVIYVGKAKNLRKRVKSYWQRVDEVGLWKGDMLSKINSIRLIQTKTEREALILESNQVKKYHPKYNVLLKDDKSFFFIKITKEKFPRVYFTREYDLEGADELFGPYTQSSTIKKTFEILQKIFKFRICQTMPRKACLLYYINLCQAPCLVNRLLKKKTIDKKAFVKTHGQSIEQFQKQYNLTIKHLKLALKGQLRELNRDIKERMKKASLQREFEQAAFWRDRLQDLNKLTSDSKIYFKYTSLYEKKGKRIIPTVREGIRKMKTSPIRLLAQDIQLPKVPKRVEGYDISNIHHTLTVGSMVVWQGGSFDSNEYRRFRIKSKRNERDDLSSLSEVLTRRLSHLPEICEKFKRKEWSVPDLLMIDGGITQFNAAVAVLNDFRMRFPENEILKSIEICSLAKKEEKLFFQDKKTGLVKNIKIKNKPYYKVIGGLRDEAHRFAINYHRLLRNKKFI